MDHQFLGIFRVLIAAVNTPDLPNKDLVMVAIGAALAEAGLPPGAVLSLFYAAQGLQPNKLDYELYHEFANYLDKTMEELKPVLQTVMEPLIKIRQQLVEAEAGISMPN